MKDSRKNVTESVTSEIGILEDNFKELDKNMQAGQKDPDIYSAKLPIIIEELRSQDKQVVSEDEWYKYTALTTVPVAGAVYMMLQGEEKISIRRITVLQHLRLILYIQLCLS